MSPNRMVPFDASTHSGSSPASMRSAHIMHFSTTPFVRVG